MLGLGGCKKRPVEEGATTTLKEFRLELSTQRLEADSSTPKDPYRVSEDTSVKSLNSF